MAVSHDIATLFCLWVVGKGVVFGGVGANTTRFFCLQSLGGCNFTNTKGKAEVRVVAKAKDKANEKVNTKAKANQN